MQVQSRSLHSELCASSAASRYHRWAVVPPLCRVHVQSQQHDACTSARCPACRTTVRARAAVCLSLRADTAQQRTGPGASACKKEKRPTLRTCHLQATLARVHPRPADLLESTV